MPEIEHALKTMPELDRPVMDNPVLTIQQGSTGQFSRDLQLLHIPNHPGS